jgi:hypothetical protein
MGRFDVQVFGDVVSHLLNAHAQPATSLGGWRCHWGRHGGGRDRRRPGRYCRRSGRRHGGEFFALLVRLPPFFCGLGFEHGNPPGRVVPVGASGIRSREPAQRGDIGGPGQSVPRDLVRRRCGRGWCRQSCQVHASSDRLIVVCGRLLMRFGPAGIVLRLERQLGDALAHLDRQAAKIDARSRKLLDEHAREHPVTIGFVGLQAVQCRLPNPGGVDGENAAGRPRVRKAASAADRTRP